MFVLQFPGKLAARNVTEKNKGNILGFHGPWNQILSNRYSGSLGTQPAKCVRPQWRPRPLSRHWWSAGQGAGASSLEDRWGLGIDRLQNQRDEAIRCPPWSCRRCMESWPHWFGDSFGYCTREGVFLSDKSMSLPSTFSELEKKKAYTALLQCRTFLCRKKSGPQRKDFGGRYGFPGFHRDFVFTTDLESFLWGQKSSPNDFSLVVVVYVFFFSVRSVFLEPL